MVVIGVLGGNDRFKGTAANILATNEFVVNLVSQDNAQAIEAPATSMNWSSRGPHTCPVSAGSAALLNLGSRSSAAS